MRTRPLISLGRTRRWRIYPGLLAGMLATGVGLSACASKPIDGPSLLQEAITLEQRAVRAAQSQDFALSDNLASESLDLYTVLDNREGQLRLLTLRSRLAVQGGLEDRARRFIQRARALTREDDLATRYELALLAGHISNDGQGEYSRAYQLATEPLPRAVALYYLQRYQEARVLVEGIEPETQRELDDMALVLHGHAKATNNRTDAEQALDYYRQAENILGISDTLFLLGQLTASQNDRPAARDYFSRALAINRRLGNAQRIAITEQALAGLSQSGQGQ